MSIEAKTENTKLNDDDLFTIVGADLSNTHSCIDQIYGASTERQALAFYYHSGSNH